MSSPSAGTSSLAQTMNLERLLALAQAAGQEIMAVYDDPAFTVELKDDQSPLTEADKRSHHCIVEGLKALTPELPILSEESKQVPYEERTDWKQFWLVDPLDGTKEFIKRNDEFTVNIALIENQRPVLGVVYVPVQETWYYACQGQGAFKYTSKVTTPQRLQGRPLDGLNELVIAGSRSHGSQALEAFVAEQRQHYQSVQFVSAGSSLKFCLVAEGQADMYPRCGPTMEWDTAAADIIVWESGKTLLQWDTNIPLRYNKPDLLNPWFICR